MKHMVKEGELISWRSILKGSLETQSGYAFTTDGGVLHFKEPETPDIVITHLPP